MSLIPHPFSLSNRTVAPLFFTPLVRGTELFLYFQHRQMISRRRSAPSNPAVCRHTASHSPLHISFFLRAYIYVRMYGTFNRIDFKRREGSFSRQNDRNECTSFTCTRNGSLYVELGVWFIYLFIIRLSDWSIEWLIDWYIDRLMDWWIYRSICRFIYLFIYLLFIYLFIYWLVGCLIDLRLVSKPYGPVAPRL